MFSLNVWFLSGFGFGFWFIFVMPNILNGKLFLIILERNRGGERQRKEKEEKLKNGQNGQGVDQVTSSDKKCILKSQMGGVIKVLDHIQP